MNDLLNIIKNVIAKAFGYVFVLLFIAFLLLMIFAEEFGFLHIVHNWATS